MNNFEMKAAPVALKRFSVNNFNNNKFLSNMKNSLNVKNIFTIDKLKRVSRQSTVLIISIILGSILHTLISSTEVYDDYVKNFDPPIIKLGRVKIKTRKLLNQVIKCIFVVSFFTMINLLVTV